METNLKEDTNISAICENLKQDDFVFEDETFDQFNVIAATGQKLRMTWFKSTEVNIFVLMGVAERITAEFMEAYSKISLSYAIKNNKLIPKSMHAITVCFPLLISSTIDDDAKQWIKQTPTKQLGFTAIPLILDSGSNSLMYHSDPAFWKSGYHKFLKELALKYFDNNG